jgi:hypothetical protein
VDDIFKFNAIDQKQHLKRGAKMYVAFVDFRKAFDSVKHYELLATMRKEGVSEKFAGAIKAMYNSLLSCVRVSNEYTDFFDCPNGVRQGCVLSPTLFCLFINQLAEHVQISGKHGIQMLPGLMELFLLLFADDVTLLATTPSGLQNQLNCLRDCCTKMGMEVNEGKTKVMVFRKGGHLGKHEKWFYNGNPVNVVNSYTYLGFTFTTKLSFKEGTDSFVAKGKKAVFHLCKALMRLKNMTRQTFFRVFDVKIQPMLMYASEIWGTQRLENIERVHMMACKRFLGVPLRTPNKMVYGELGRYPLFVNSTVRCLKYWLRVLKMDDSRFPKQAYNMMISMDESEKNCWVTEVKNVLSRNGFYCVWLQQGVGNEKKFLSEFKQRLSDNFVQEWNATIRDKDRYLPYRNFKTMFEPEQYLSLLDIYCFRVGLCQLRLGVLPINNNLQRYSDCPGKRNCIFCDTVVVNEEHFLFTCPLYVDIRTKLLNNALQNEITSLATVLSWKSKKNMFILAKFVFNAIKRRKEFAQLN